MKLRRLVPLFGLFLLFFAAALGLYYAGLRAPMCYDSAAKLEARAHFFDDGIFSALKVFPQRPVSVISFYVNYLLTAMISGYFRVANILHLAAAAVVVMLIIRLILETPVLSGSTEMSSRRWLSFLVGVAFLVHPLNAYVTLYVWQRMALLACLFYYSSLAAYLAVRLDKFHNTLLGTGMAISLFVCAVLSKENGITLPFVLLIVEAALFRQSWKISVRRVFPYFLALLGVAVLFSFLQFPHGNERLNAGILSTLEAYYRESGLALSEVALTQSRMVFYYLSLIVAPLPWRVQLVSPQVISRSLFSPPETFVAVVSTVLLVAVGFYLLKKRPLSGFGILFYLINLIPEAFLVPQYAFFAYRAVLPMLGIFLVLTDVIMVVLDAAKETKLWWLIRTAIVVTFSGCVVFLASVTAIKASVWGNEVRFWRDTVAQFPVDFHETETRAAAQAFTNLGTALYREGAYPEAVQYYSRALELMPTNAAALASLGSLYTRVGKRDQAEQLLRKAIAEDPYLAFAHRNLGDLLTMRNRSEEAGWHLRRASDLSGQRTIRK
jgi:protein O-mannosyl-transferase